MHATDYHGSPIRSAPRTPTHDPNETDITNADSFQKQVAESFLSLSSDDFLSIKWTRELLDTFLFCQAHFRSIVQANRSVTTKPPMDRLLSDYYERIVKALDVCNAIRDGIEQIRRWEKLLEIVLCALGDDKALGEGQFRRAKKALIDLAIGMLDEKDSGSGSGTGSSIAHRNRSFSRSKDQRSIAHFRSLSWSVSRSWSAAKQIQAIGYNLNPPRGNEIIATGGLAVAVYAMGSVVLLVMWALVAAIPCQDRGLQVHFSISRQFPWGAPMVSVYEKIVEESKKRERKNACGLLKEIYEIEKRTRLLSELVDSVRFPLSEEKEKEVRTRVEELRLVYEAIKEGLDPLEKQVREVFHRIVRDRTEGTSSCPV